MAVQAPPKKIRKYPCSKCSMKHATEEGGLCKKCESQEDNKPEIIPLPPGCTGSSLKPCDSCGKTWSARDRVEVNGEQLPIHFRSFAVEHKIHPIVSVYEVDRLPGIVDAIDLASGEFVKRAMDGRRTVVDFWPIGTIYFWLCEECYRENYPDFRSIANSIKDHRGSFQWTTPIEAIVIEDDPSPFEMTPREWIEYYGEVPEKLRLLPEDKQSLSREIGASPSEVEFTTDFKPCETCGKACSHKSNRFCKSCTGQLFRKMRNDGYLPSKNGNPFKSKYRDTDHREVCRETSGGTGHGSGH